MFSAMSDYRVNLETYNGPLDLLLYLIQREELDIHDIPVSLITEQYVRHVELLKRIDPNLAGEFLVLAATLMEIKTRMLLPSPPDQEGGEEGVGIDPRSELVRQLLQYKAFKDAAGDLRAAAQIQAMRLPRQPTPTTTEQRQVDLEDVQVWDLLDAFSRLMTAVAGNITQQDVIYDDTPVELHAADIVDRLEREGALTFDRIFEGRTSRTEVVGLFIALLELVRQRKILAAQEADFGEIRIRLNPDPPDDQPRPPGDGNETPAAGQLSPGPPTEEESPETQHAKPSPDGQYVSDTPSEPDGDRDNGDEPLAAGG